MTDIVVIGAGPAGSTAATLLARKGFSVTLLEREKFPRFQIGESLLPFNNDLFARLGIIEQLRARGGAARLRLNQRDRVRARGGQREESFKHRGRFARIAKCSTSS